MLHLSFGVNERVDPPCPLPLHIFLCCESAFTALRSRSIPRWKDAKKKRGMGVVPLFPLAASESCLYTPTSSPVNFASSNQSGHVSLTGTIDGLRELIDMVLGFQGQFRLYESIRVRTSRTYDIKNICLWFLLLISVFLRVLVAIVLMVKSALPNCASGQAQCG